VSLTLKLLDGFELSHRDEPIPLSPACQRVVAFLALHDRQLRRVHVAGALWLDVSEERSCANLRSALWRMRRYEIPVVHATTTDVGLSRDVFVDVDELVAAARRVLRGGARDEEDIDGTYETGELLPDWYDEWLEPERERLRQLRLHALEATAEGLLESGRTAYAIDALMVGLRADPLRESLHRTLIRAHVAQGNTSEAVRCYQTYRGRLGNALGVSPSAQMEALVGGLGVALPAR